MSRNRRESCDCITSTGNSGRIEADDRHSKKLHYENSDAVQPTRIPPGLEGGQFSSGESIDDS